MQKYMSLKDLLSSDAFTPVNKKLARELWFTTAWYLAELIRQRERFGSDEFFFSQKQMEEELWFTEYEQRQSLKILKESGFINVQKKGLPCKYYFSISDSKILSSFEEQVLENMEDQCLKIWSTRALKNEAHNNKDNNKENNKWQQLDIMSEEIYQAYMLDQPQDKKKYAKKAQSMLYISSLLKTYDSPYLLSCIATYKKNVEKKWWKAPQYFFSNTKNANAKEYMFFLDYAPTSETLSKPKKTQEDIEKAMLFFNS